MRHAKSDWGDASISDHDRPLNGRGRRDAPRMAAWIESIDSVPDVILCSSATRTTQTAELMIQHWSTAPKLIRSERLYLSNPETILRLIDTEASSATRLLVIAHNPGISSLVSHLADQLLPMPTAGVAVFSDKDGEFQFETFMRPKALPDQDADSDAL
jgi:phosphohistidine phosphatase